MGYLIKYACTHQRGFSAMQIHCIFLASKMDPKVGISSLSLIIRFLMCSVHMFLFKLNKVYYRPNLCPHFDM